MTDSRSQFNDLLRQVLEGRISRRQVVGGAAALGVGGVGAGAMRTRTVSAASLASFAQDATPKPGGILKVGLQADPTALDPHQQTLTAIWHVIEHIYNRLTRIKPDLTVEPELAESWEVAPDGLTYTFKLRQGVMFHPPVSRALVAGDVKFSFERLKSPESNAASDLDTVESIEAPDDATVVIKMKKADASLLSVLSGQSAIIFPPETIEANQDLSQVAVGTGPFIFKEYVPNTRITLEKNPEYWEEGLPYLDGMELIPVSEDTARTTAVVTGTVDFAEYAPLRDIELLQEDPKIELAGDANTNIRFIGFNLSKEPFDDIRVRRAVSLAIDRTAVIDAAVFGKGTPTEVLFPETYWAALKQPVGAQDIEQAKTLMTEAGFSEENRLKTTITSWSAYSFLSNAATVVQEQLKQIFIDAEMNLVENATMIQQVYTDKTYDIAVTGDSAYMDPNFLIYGNFGTGQSGNFVNYSNPEVDQLIDQGIAETDQAKRAEIYQQIQAILLEELPWVNLFIANQYEAMQSYVKGYTHIPTGSNLELRKVWLDK